MIDKIILKNFQSHQSSELDFHNGVTVITGSSNQGKTSVLRALNWVINNRPRGKGIIRRGEDLCEVSLYANGRLIKRVRSKNENCYYFITNNDEIKFEALGGNIPEEIVSLLNIKEINIQEQLDPYFLVLDSPGKVGLYINSITKLDEVDRIISQLSSLIRTEISTQTQLNVELQQIEDEERIYKDFDLKDFEKKVEKYCYLVKDRREVLCLEITSLKSTISMLKEVKDELHMISLPINIIELIEDSKSLPKQYKDLEDQAYYLDTLIVDYDNYSSELLIIKSVDFSLLDEVDKYKNKMSHLTDDIEFVNHIILEIKDSIYDIKFCEKTMKSFDDEISYIMQSELADCPYCGQELNDEARIVLCKGIEV